MSDYLDYLAARSLGLTSGLQPRLPGLFEPLHGDAGSGWMNAPRELDTPNGEPASQRQQIPGLSPSLADPGTELPARDRIASMSLETLTHSDPKVVPSLDGPRQSSRQADSSLAKIQTYEQEEKESAVLSASGPLNSISTPKAAEPSDEPAQRDDSFLAQSSSDESLTKLADRTGATLPARQASEQIAQGSLSPQATEAFGPVAAYNDPALPDRSDQRADATLDVLSSESLTRFSRPAESDLPAGSTFGQAKRESVGLSDPVSFSNASAALSRSRRRANLSPAPSSSETFAQPSHPKESDLPVVQTSRQESASQPEIGPLGSVSSSKVPMAQREDTLLISADTPTVFPAQPEENPDGIHSSVSGSPEQERPDSKSSPTPGWMETKFTLQAARAQARVPSAEAMSRRPNAAQASSESISARLDRIQHAVLTATSTEKQDHPSLLPESQIETIEGALPSSALTGGIPVRPTIQPAGPLQPGRSQMSPPRPVLHTEAPPEPVIHVNIGRIEVRAAPQTLAKRAPQSTLPTLSLDEYLKQLEDKR